MKSKKINLQWVKSVIILIMIIIIYKIMSRLDVYAIACSLLVVVLVLSISYARSQAKKDIEMMRKSKPQPLQFQYIPIKRKKFDALKLEQLRKMNPYQFERYIAKMYQQLGYSNAYATQRSNDEGRDVIMNHDKTGQLYFVECKRYSEDTVISRPIVQKLQGVCSAYAAKGIIITTGRYTDPALNFAKKVGIECVRVPQLLDMIERAEKVEREKEQVESTELNTSVSSN